MLVSFQIFHSLGLVPCEKQSLVPMLGQETRLAAAIFPKRLLSTPLPLFSIVARLDVGILSECVSKLANNYYYIACPSDAWQSRTLRLRPQTPVSALRAFHVFCL